MTCPLPTPTLNVTLQIQRSRLLYDIANNAYIVGHTADTDTNEQQHTLHMTIDVTQPGNIDRVNQVLSLVHAAAVEMLYPYTKAEATDGDTFDAQIEEPDTYPILLTVPATMSRTTLTLLARLVHEWMVYRALADWLMITDPQAAQAWIQRAADVETQINTAKNLRTGTLRRALNPF